MTARPDREAFLRRLEEQQRQQAPQTPIKEKEKENFDPIEKKEEPEQKQAEKPEENDAKEAAISAECLQSYLESVGVTGVSLDSIDPSSLKLLQNLSPSAIPLKESQQKKTSISSSAEPKTPPPILEVKVSRLLKEQVSTLSENNDPALLPIPEETTQDTVAPSLTKEELQNKLLVELRKECQALHIQQGMMQRQVLALTKQMDRLSESPILAPSTTPPRSQNTNNINPPPPRRPPQLFFFALLTSLVTRALRSISDTYKKIILQITETKFYRITKAALDQARAENIHANLDRYLLLKLLFFVAFFGGRNKPSSSKTGGVLAKYRIYVFAVVAILIYLIQTGLLAFAWRFVRTDLGRIWRGEEAPVVDVGNAAVPEEEIGNVAINPQGEQPVRVFLADGGIERRGGIFTDLKYLLGGFVMSLLPTWKPIEAHVVQVENDGNDEQDRGPAGELLNVENNE